MRRKKQQPPPRYFTTDGELRKLTPFEKLLLSAFDTGETDHRFHDSITLAGFLLGGRAFPRPHFTAAERMATLALRDLVSMGYLVADSLGWLRLADNPPAQDTPQQTKGTTDDN